MTMPDDRSNNETWDEYRVVTSGEHSEILGAPRYRPEALRIRDLLQRLTPRDVVRVEKRTVFASPWVEDPPDGASDAQPERTDHA